MTLKRTPRKTAGWRGSGRIAVCIKTVDASGSSSAQSRAEALEPDRLRVTYQNRLCRSLCGDAVGLVCKHGCMKLFRHAKKLPSLTEGLQLYRAQEVNGVPVDVLLTCDVEAGELTTILYTPGANAHALSSELASQGLSEREIEILSYVTKGYSRAETATALGITKGTLKSHLNSVYRKLPPELRATLPKRSVAK